MEKPRITIVLDIAPLGYAFERRAAARGIHRVCAELFVGLLNSDECDLRFVATSHLAGAYAFLRQKHPTFLNKLQYKKSHLKLSEWAASANEWIERTLSHRALFYRGLRFAVNKGARWADARAQRIPRQVLAEAHLYHSSFAPIPREVLANKKVCHFITINDLLPITNPESVGGKGVRDIQEIINPLTEDSFAFCLSEHVRKELCQHSRVHPEHAFVSLLAADPQLFYPIDHSTILNEVRSKYGLGRDPYFLALSSFDPRKNFGHIIDCFSHLVESGRLTRCNLVIVGSNPERSVFVSDALAKYPKTQNAIYLTGYVPDEDLAAIYSGALAFLFPSLAEGFGIPAIEAMQCGTPVLSSNAPALPEVVGDGGLLLSPRDIPAWSEAMVKVASDPEFRSLLSHQARKRARLFSWPAFIQTTLTGYRRAAGIG